MNQEQSLYNHFCQEMKILEPYTKDEIIVVACSGGSDSMALCLLTQKYCQDHDLQLKAVIVNHGLRHNSFAEAHEVKLQLAKLKIDAQVLSISISKPTNSKPTKDNLPGSQKLNISQNNIMAAARKARYECLVSFCQQNNCHILLIGHHQNDQQEHMQLKNLRHSGIKGALLPKAILRQEIIIFRPLLNEKKTTLQQLLSKNNIHWVEDPTNQNLEFNRNNIRAENIFHKKTFNSNMFEQLKAKQIQTQQEFLSILATSTMLLGFGSLAIDISKCKKQISSSKPCSEQAIYYLFSYALSSISQTENEINGKSLASYLKKIFSTQTASKKHQPQQKPTVIGSCYIEHYLINIKQTCHEYLVICPEVSKDFLQKHAFTQKLSDIVKQFCEEFSGFKKTMQNNKSLNANLSICQQTIKKQTTVNISYNLNKMLHCSKSSQNLISNRQIQKIIESLAVKNHILGLCAN